MVSQQVSRLYHLIISKLSRSQIIVSSIVVFSLLVGIIMLVGSRHSPGLIPDNLKKQISFVLFLPSSSPEMNINTKSFRYDPVSKVFTFKMQYDHSTLTIAEQATPQNFIDIPQAYDKVMETLNEYASFNSYYDKVSLTRPKEFKGQQSAIMNSKGTLITAHPTKGELTEDQWKKLFNGLELIR